jgi:predicted amidohydrolase YtcJ
MHEPLHLERARIWTGVPEHPWAHAVTVEGGRITALDGAAPRGARTIDMAERVVVPGFIDSHVHLLLGGLALDRLDLSGVRSRAEFESAIARTHASLPAGAWLLAGGWSQENWPGAELPDKSWLASAGDRPVVCYRMDEHAALVNDAVLARCDLNLAHDEPEARWGGRVVRDDDGVPTGLMLEAAAWQIVNPIMPAPDAGRKRAALRAAETHFHQYGVTTVGSMEYRRDLEGVLAPERDRLRLRCRVTLLDRRWPMTFDAGRDFPADDRLAVVGYKAFLDGTLGSRTARLIDPYDDDPGNRGMLVELAAEGHLHDWAQGVVAAGLSPSMHAIGDEAARLALDVTEAVRATCADARSRIEHAQQVHPVDLDRFAGVVASMQPLHKADDGRYATARLGERRLSGTFAFRRLLDAGAVLAFGSDWPIVSCDPMPGIRAAVTGLTGDGTPFLTDQNLTVEETLVAYTRNAAFALGLEGDAGRVAPGAFGDLAVLDRDPFTADWAADPPQVAMTIVGGVVEYERERAAVAPS